jgi:hypothetical protein
MRRIKSNRRWSVVCGRQAVEASALTGVCRMAALPFCRLQLYFMLTAFLMAILES